MAVDSVPGKLSHENGTARAGVIVMLLGMLMFSVNDVMGKWLVATYSVGQVVLIRSIAAVLLLAPFLWVSGPKKLFTLERPGLQLARVVASTAEVIAFYFAVVYLPLADVMTYWLAAPIYVAAISPLVLKEPVGWRRWTAIAIGFVGVVVALEPSSQAFTLPAVISILGSMAFAFMMISGRSLRGTPDTTLAFWQIAGAAVAGLVWAPFDWTPLKPLDTALLCLLGVVAMGRPRACQPGAEARRRRDGSPAAIHAPFLGNLLRMADLRRYAAAFDGTRRRPYRRLGPLHLFPRTAAEEAGAAERLSSPSFAGRRINAKNIRYRAYRFRL